VVVGGGGVPHDGDERIGCVSVSNEGSAVGRGVIGDSEDGTSRIRGEVRGGARGNYRELKVGGRGRVEPLGFDAGLVRTGGVVDTLPSMDACAGRRGVEKDVDVGSIEASGIPRDVNGSGILKSLGGLRGLVEPTGTAGLKKKGTSERYQAR